MLDKGIEKLKADRIELMHDGEALEWEENQVRRARKEVEKERETARQEGFRQGHAEGVAKSREEGLREAREIVDEHVARLQTEWTTLRGLEGDLDDAIRDVKKSAPTADMMRQTMQQTVHDGAPNVIYAFLMQRDMKLKEAGKQPGWVKSFERFAEQRLGKDWRKTWTQETQTHASAIEYAQRKRQELQREAEEALRTMRRDDDGLGF